MSDTDGESDLPPAAECEKRCQEFAAVTGTDTALAMFYLQDRKWDLELSLNAYFEERGIPVDPGNLVAQSSGAAAANNESTVDKEPHRIRLISWNIDGLDTNNLMSRTNAVCETIRQENPDVVFLQEVVTDSLKVLEDKCPQYSVIPGNHEGYFIAMMLKCSSVTMSNRNITPFYSSMMARNLLSVEALVKGVPFLFMTSHLESTASHADERKKQLQICFDKIREAKQDSTIVFGGDLNLRDKELASMNGVPDGIMDLWEVTGKRPEAKFTWDLKRNDNLSWDAKFRPQCRFDRLYMRHSANRQIKPVYFELIGLQRLKSCRRFPSDHWGILAHFDKIQKTVSVLKK